MNTTTPSDLAQLAKRAKPESIYASKLVSPFSAIRYSLARQNTKEANDLIAELGTTMTDLRDMRNEPDKIPWSELQAKTDAAIAKVQGSPWGSDETIAKAIERYKSYLSEYEVAKAAQAQQPAPEEAP